MKKNLEEFVRCCLMCSAQKELRTIHSKSEALGTPHLFAGVFLNHVSSRTFASALFNVLVMVDQYSRYMVVVVTKSTRAYEIVAAFRDY